MSSPADTPFVPPAPGDDEQLEIAALADQLARDEQARLQAAAELVRARSFVKACRRSRLPPALATMLRTKLPPQLSPEHRKALAESRREPSPVEQDPYWWKKD